MKVLGVIPARYASSRFPGKPLALLAGKTMIERVYRQAEKCATLDTVLVATDDERIASTVRGFGGRVQMTPADCPTGTDRTALVARAEPDYGIVLNIQGDEPLLEPEAIDSAVRMSLALESADITTLVRPARSAAELDDPNAVKVVLAAGGRILYFSRGRAPFCKDGRLVENVGTAREHPWRSHIGLYVHKRESLLRQVSLSPVLIERSEGLEQLRALHSGMNIYAAEVRDTASIGVDTPEDIAAVERFIEERGLR